MLLRLKHRRLSRSKQKRLRFETGASLSPKGEGLFVPKSFQLNLAGDSLERNQVTGKETGELMPKSVYFPKGWHLWDCQRWCDERRLPWDFIERCEHGPTAYIWINLEPGYSYAVYGEASR